MSIYASNEGIKMSEQLASISPEDVVGGVWVAGEQRFMPVERTRSFTDEAYGFTLHEYSDPEGNVRASLLDLPVGGLTPAWHIKEPNAGYLEIHQVVSGRGQIVIKPNEDDYTRSGYYTDKQERRIFDLRSATHPVEQGQLQTIMIKPGETFQVIASEDGPVQLLAVMPIKPFELEFEERMAPFFG